MIKHRTEIDCRQTKQHQTYRSFYKNSTKTESPGRLKGLSNTTHTFTILATNPNRQKIAIEIMSQDKPQEIAIINLYIKAYDTKPTKTILITNTNTNQQAERLTQNHKIHTIPANPDIKQLKEEIKKTLAHNQRSQNPAKKRDNQS